jgi:hypothetical protein
MPISDLSDEELDRFEENYRRANKTEGGKYALSEILLEKKRRKPSRFGVRNVAAKIVDLAAASDDGMLTYGDLWNAFCPNIPWEGHKTMQVVTDSLGRVVYYCVTNRLPILTVLVVNASNRKLTNQAIENIFRECRDLGVDVGLDPNRFVANQIELSRAVVIDQLPDDSITIAPRDK